MSQFTYSKLDHDIGIKRTDATTFGFVLARDKNDRPIYKVYNDQYLATQQYTDPSYAALPPEKELKAVFDDWRNGFGQKIYDSDDPRRYHVAHNMDARFKGQIIQGPAAAAVTLPTLMTIVDGGLEIWTDVNTLTNWTEDGTGADLIRESTIIHGGTYSAKFAGSDTPGGVWQAMTGWSTAFQGATVIISAYLYATAASIGRIKILDGTNTSNSDYVAGDSAWHQVTLKHKFAADATKCEVHLRNETTGSADVYVDDVEYNIIHGNKHFAEFDSDLCIGNGRVLYRVNGSTGAVTYACNFPAAITALEAYKTYLMIAIGNSNNYYYMTTAEVFTQAASVATKFKTVGGTLWKADTTYNIYSSTNGTTWSGATTVGGSDYNITDLLTDGTTLVIPKRDRVFYLDSLAVPQVLISETASLSNSTSGINSFYWKGKYYFQYGESSLIEYDSGTNTWRNPSNYGTDIGDFDGNIQAISGDDEYLYATIDNSTKIEILAGRLETIEGSTSWVWHPIHEMTLTGCGISYVSSIYQKRLWVASTLYTESLYYIPLYTSYGDVTNDANRLYSTTATCDIETSWLHFNFKSTPKAWIKVVSYLGHTYSANIYFEVHYKKYGDADWTKIDDVKGAADSSDFRIVTDYIPVDSSANKPSSTMMKFKWVGKTNSTTTTPILNSFEIGGILYPEKRRLIECVINASDNPLDKSSQAGGLGSVIKTVLEEANNATYPCEFYNIDGATKNVRVMGLEEIIEENGKARNLARRFHLLLAEVTIS